MTDHSTSADAGPRAALPGLIVALLALLVAAAALWMSYSSATRPVNSQDHAAVAAAPNPAIDEIKQSLSSVQLALQGIQSAQEKLTAQVNDIQQKVSAQRGEQKLLSDQFGALSARVNSLESAKADSSAPAPQRTKRGNRQ